MIASVALFSLIAIANLPACDKISSSEPIIMPPDSSPPKINLGFTPLEVAERLGHEKIETTLNTYAHLYPNSQKKIADRLEEENKEKL